MRHGIELEAHRRAAWLKAIIQPPETAPSLQLFGRYHTDAFKKARKLLKNQPNNKSYQTHYRRVCYQIAQDGPTFPNTPENRRIVRRIAEQYGLVRKRRPVKMVMTPTPGSTDSRFREMYEQITPGLFIAKDINWLDDFGNWSPERYKK